MSHAYNETFSLISVFESLFSLHDVEQYLFWNLTLLHVSDCSTCIVEKGREEYLQQILFQRCFHWELFISLHSFKNSIQYLFKVFIEQIRSLENLKYDLKENGSFCIIYWNIWLHWKECLVSNLNQHSDTIWVLHDLLFPKYHVIVERIHKRISKGIFILYKHILHAREYCENCVRDFACLLDKIFDDHQDIVLNFNFAWVNHKFKYWFVDFLKLVRISKHECLVLGYLLQNVNALLHKQSMTSTCWRQKLVSSSSDNSLSN